MSERPILEDGDSETNEALEQAAQAVIEAQRLIWELWQATPVDDPLEERLDFASGELVNIVEDLKQFSEVAKQWVGPWRTAGEAL